ncbi:hypothetical protein LEL_04175 [Akanthomyces lecanii RCEF 1005]|uniref:Uncharacterized protein n=1 Tax=Akanthomyces lecanii RCEF 1005 TaxID=1081108 RepID=A0A162K3D3_CORDF|nr:hypothetical protein LEL_04175 [Akanthomyces lecanii RCEF 1005]
MPDWVSSVTTETIHSASSFGATIDKKSVDDEATVNAALITFANGFPLFGLGGGSNGRWDLYPRPFHVRDASNHEIAVCEARVDGTYRLGPEIKAIVEVKPFRRFAENDAQITMQEGAQMASWISECPPAQGTDHNGTYRRLLVSQDRDDIYFTVCTFSDEYIRYIRREMSQTQMIASRKNKSGFMTMKRQGPYKLGDPTMMRSVSKIILAFCLQGSLD